MCDQAEVNYLDGEVVWVKLGSCWWPGEVVAPEKLPPDLLPSFRKPPIAVVKFFQEETYEYVKNVNNIYKYNCSRKNEFINKGLYMFRTKHGPMEKFPDDVVRAEVAIGGDKEILTKKEFQEQKKESYAGLFGDQSKRTPGSAKKGKSPKGLQTEESPRLVTPIRKIKEKVDYKVHILVQGSKSTPAPSSEIPPLEIEVTPLKNIEQESNKDNEQLHENGDGQKTENIIIPPTISTTPVVSSSGIYSCHACSFTTSRLNVLILHNKTHSISFTPYTPSPVRKKLPKTIRSTPKTSKTPKIRKPRMEKSEKLLKSLQNNKKRASHEQDHVDSKKAKTDEEIKTSLLADWDDGDDESNNDSLDPAISMVMTGSPEVPEAAESPAIPTSADISNFSIPGEISSPIEKKCSPVNEKPECSSDSKYEFREDEDWPLEADVGRKIPRVKKPKNKDDTKSLSLDDDDMAREVAELLNKTTVPDLPSAPEPLKVEENFPEPSIIKSPDKREKTPEKLDKPIEQPTKAIFKTKTFFRSRHSRSQDAIGKYVAEQLNAVERMDISESEINGSEPVSSPEARESPPVEHVKVARLAPKIQLKKMKAEAAQLRERERSIIEQLTSNLEFNPFADLITTNTAKLQSENSVPERENENKQLEAEFGQHLVNEKLSQNKPLLDVLYPTQEIKPVNMEVDYVKSKINKMKNTEVATIKEINRIEMVNDVPKASVIEIPKIVETSLQVTYVQPIEPYMNESTASAVDALLSVSRDADRVTRVISDDPPENLFEDDIKENNVTCNNVNGHNELNENVDVTVNYDRENNEEKAELKNDFDVFTSNEKSQDCVTHSMLVEKSIINNEGEDINKGKDFNKEGDISKGEDFSKNKDVSQEETVSNEEHISDEKDNCKEEDICKEKLNIVSVPENVPSESVLQIAETLINLPSTAIQSKPSNELIEHASVQDINQDEVIPPSIDPMIIDKLSQPSFKEQHSPTQTKSLLISNNEALLRFETEQEKSENLNAAQSLVQMSESIDHKINIDHNLNAINSKEMSDSNVRNVKQKNGFETLDSVEEKVAMLSNDNNSQSSCGKSVKSDTSSSKLLKILEDKSVPKVTSYKQTVAKQVLVSGKEKILNFDVAKSTFKGKPESPKQKIIIRRTAASKSIINNMNDTGKQEKIILSPSNSNSSDGSVKTYTIQTSQETTSDANTIIIQQKIRKMAKQPSKLQKIKPQNTLINPLNETKIINEAASDDAIFDINSMPIVLSEDLLTPENIEKMPFVMSDGNIIGHSQDPPKLLKTKPPETEKIAISATSTKSEVKTLLMNPVTEVSKVSTPNILSKSSKLRSKPMLVIDKTTGKQKIIMTKGDSTVKEVKQAPALIQSAPQTSAKSDKFIILPTTSSPRPGKRQKIVIDPQTGKAHVLVAKGSETTIVPAENKPVSAKLIPSCTEISSPGNTVMIITNAQGAQSRIVLTPEHEKMLFPKKQQSNASQLKTIAHRISTNPGVVQKTVVTTVAPHLVPTKPPARIVSKQKSAIITSKGQLIVGGRVTTTTPNIAPMPEIRPVPKRVMASEPKKLVQTIQKSSPETLIFLQQKSGAVMQLTAAQFEHLQRTGQIVQKTTPADNKVVLQKTIMISPNEAAPAASAYKPRVRKNATESPAPMKKLKQEISILPVPVPAPALSPLPPSSSLTATPPLTNTIPAAVPSVSNTVSVSTTNAYPEFDNFEELLPSTAIARQQEPVPQVPQLEPVAPPPAPLSDGQLLAVPGEHFGGPPGSFYLCVEDNGTLTPIDNRPLVLENNQLVPMTVEPLPVLAPQPERRDILEAALANSDVFQHTDTARDEAPDFRDLNANVSVHCRVSETSTTLNQPIMTPVEVPTKVDSEPTVPSNLEDGLAVIGVTPHSIPTSLELPITVTDPRIAPKTTDPLSGTNYGPTLLPSPSTEMTFSTSEEPNIPMTGPISMPLLTEEESVGKSMPILTDEVAERAVSSVESTIDSPSSTEIRESETEDGGQWTRRLLTPGSDTSEASAEIPLQPILQLSVNELSRHS